MYGVSKGVTCAKTRVGVWLGDCYVGIFIVCLLDSLVQRVQRLPVLLNRMGRDRIG